ncbi:hypothetical protein BD310DRAFT_929533 [Dichomitus squalens]|uniref:Uncharacterized protein n=1 Tax=Dichomitus squalens TaxID=114155 RepID=A0A4Q9PSF3_9APHY|nr:hypothetical protein BD310DRAFT_929533 [Dichomitus squalens]
MTVCSRMNALAAAPATEWWLPPIATSRKRCSNVHREVPVIHAPRHIVPRSQSAGPRGRAA